MFSGCWALPELFPVTNFACDLHGLDLKPHGNGGVSSIASLLFAEDVVLFAAKCEVFETTVNTSRSEVMDLCWKTVDCSLPERSELLLQ